MRFDQGITDFPYRAGAADAFGDDGRRLEGLGLGVGDGDGAADGFQQRHIVDVVADVGGLVHFESQVPAQLFQHGAFVFDAGKDMAE